MNLTVNNLNKQYAINKALSGYPDVIILDEPTACFDPNEWIRFRNIVSKAVFERIVVI